jgi:hypothetical protein
LRIVAIKSLAAGMTLSACRQPAMLLTSHQMQAEEQEAAKVVNFADWRAKLLPAAAIAER